MDQEIEPTESDPILEEAREIYQGYYEETLKQREEEGDDSAVEYVGQMTEEDVEKTALGFAQELAEAGVPGKCVSFLELTDLDEAGKLEMLALAEERIMEFAAKALKKAKARAEKEPGEALSQTIEGSEEEIKKKTHNLQVLRRAVEILKEQKNG